MLVKQKAAKDGSKSRRLFHQVLKLLNHFKEPPKSNGSINYQLPTRYLQVSQESLSSDGGLRWLRGWCIFVPTLAAATRQRQRIRRPVYNMSVHTLSSQSTDMRCDTGAVQVPFFFLFFLYLCFCFPVTLIPANLPSACGSVRHEYSL